MAFYGALGTVLLLLAITAPAALAFGFGGAMAARSPFAPLSWIGRSYIAIVRGVPDIAFFLFFVIALDQALEYLRHKVKCPDWDQPIRQGSDFIVCQAAKMPLGNSPQWVHEAYGFSLAVLTFAIVFGAFAANVLFGAMRAVPRAQLETAEDIVYWARELGGAKTPRFTDYPHPDWRMWYFLALLVFYLCFTRLSEIVLDRLMQRLTRGQATAGGENQRKAMT